MEKIVLGWDENSKIYKFENGKLAFDNIESLKPDIVLTDIKMPIMDGLDLARKVFQEQLDTDMIIISGYSEFEYARRAIKYGVVDYILKPIDKKELIEILNSIKQNKSSNSIPETYTKDADFKSIAEIIQEMKEYIIENYDKDISLEKLAKNKYYINYSYLSRVFKEKTGLSFTKYIIKVRMEKAREYIENDNCISVSEVALKVGYNDVSNFIQIFKKYYGYTPGTCSKKIYDN